MEELDDPDPMEQDFHNNVREQIVSYNIFLATFQQFVYMKQIGHVCAPYYWFCLCDIKLLSKNRKWNGRVVDCANFEIIWEKKQIFCLS